MAQELNTKTLIDKLKGEIAGNLYRTITSVDKLSEQDIKSNARMMAQTVISDVAKEYNFDVNDDTMKSLQSQIQEEMEEVNALVDRISIKIV